MGLENEEVQKRLRESEMVKDKAGRSQNKWVSEQGARRREKKVCSKKKKEEEEKTLITGFGRRLQLVSSDSYHGRWQLNAAISLPSEGRWEEMNHQKRFPFTALLKNIRALLINMLCFRRDCAA